MEKFDAWNILLSFVSMLLTYVSIMVTFFFKGQKEIKNILEGKVSKTDCEKNRKECEADCEKSRQERAKYIHLHASVGQAGEVIK